MLHEWVNWPRHFWRRLRRLPPSNDAWDDERWTAILTVIIQQRKKTYLPTAAIRIGTFCAEVKELPDSKGYKVVDQVKTRFQDRDWQPPANIDKPEEEQDVLAIVEKIHANMQEESARNRKLLVEVLLLAQGGHLNAKTNGAANTNGAADTKSQVRPEAAPTVPIL